MQRAKDGGTVSAQNVISLAGTEPERRDPRRPQGSKNRTASQVRTGGSGKLGRTTF